MSKLSYSELITLPTFEERFRYLQLNAKVAQDIFGSRRYLNQELYHSSEWRRFRDEMIIRDSGRDLAIEGYEIYGPVLIHHLNPITYDDIINKAPCIFDPENAVCTQHRTHNAIHYGDESLLLKLPKERTPNDTCPWKIRR